VGEPRYKSRKGRQSIRFSNQAIQKKITNLELGLIGLQRCKKPFKFINHRQFTGELRSVTVSLNPDGKYYISFLVKETIEPMKSAGRAVGIDVGIKDLMVLSTGTKFDNPKLMLEKANRALKQAQKQLSRKKRGSKNREKARLKVAKAYKRVTNIKRNYYHIISTYLVRNFDEIFMEDLNVNGMLKNRRLSAAIHSASWSTLIEMIKYKSDWNNRNFHQISRWFPSSKTCSCCGHVLEQLSLSTRDWVCPVCGQHHDRDLNAAVNILNQGQLDCYDTILFGSATDLMGASLPMALVKHSSKIERSGSSDSVRVGIEQADLT
jgi:putative transposase